MLASERRKRMIDLLEHQGWLTTAEVATTLEVSEMTVRRDLGELEHRGLLRRVHGGAEALSSDDVGYALRSRKNHEAKRLIGARAAALVKDGETVYVDAGTTAMEVALALRRRRPKGVMVVTHAVNIAAQLAGQPTLSVVQIGGEIYRKTYAATGPAAVAAIRRLSFDKVFLAAQGFGFRDGLSNSNLAEVEVKQAALVASSWVCLIADASKWEQKSLAYVAPLERLHAVVSDEALLPGGRRALAARGIELHLATKRARG